MTPFLGFGVGLRPPHYQFVLENPISVDWFEIISENFMGIESGGKWGRHRKTLDEVRSKFKIVMHGVSMSIGSTDPLNMNYLARLKELADTIQPEWVSDHLCWTGVEGENLHDLLPLPFTEEAIVHLVSRIQVAQDFLKRNLLLENVSAYLNYTHNEMSEWEFVAEIARRSGCKILLDVNNIYVSAINNRFEPATYLQGIPKEIVGQFHLAGHTDCGTHLIDTHDGPVCHEVWNLYEEAVRRFGNVSTLVEWDGNIPEFEVLEGELQKARDRHAKVINESKTNATHPRRASTLDEMGHH